jgi:hypothetical protein
MTKRIILNIIFILSCFSFALSQEVVVGLQSNPVIRDNHDKNEGAREIKAGSLVLPFFDDFSGRNIFPDPARWSDNFAFINNTYSIDQITTGVATLDALDNTGRLYEAASTIVFTADYLTSNPIDLALSASDSIRLSFFRQEGLQMLRKKTTVLYFSFFPLQKGNGIQRGRLQEGNIQISSRL